MSATVHVLGRPSSYRTPPVRTPRVAPMRAPTPGNAWLVDVAALARARAVLSGHDHGGAPTASQPALLEVPQAYEQFCRSHFTAVRRLRPELRWEDALPAYAVALSAHALLCDALDAGRERALGEHWPQIRGDSQLEWREASGLVVDGCRALARLDPLAMQR